MADPEAPADGAAPVTRPIPLRTATVAEPFAEPFAEPVVGARPLERGGRGGGVWLLFAAPAWVAALAGVWLLPSSAAGQAVGLGLWLLAVVGTVVGAALAQGVPLLAIPLLAAVPVLLAAWLAPWSALDGRSYYGLHRPLFDAVADDLRASPPGAEATGVPVATLLRPIAPEGARVVARIGRQPVVLLPQPGTRDAVGYAYLDGDPPPDLRIDLTAVGGGPLVALTDGLYLGDGWWWI